MKGHRADAKTGKVEEVDDGLPFPVHIPPKEPVGVNLEDLAKLVKVAKDRKWI